MIINVVSSVVQFFCAILFLLAIILNDNTHFIETISKCVSFYADFFFYFGNYNSFLLYFFWGSKPWPYSSTNCRFPPFESPYDHRREDAYWISALLFDVHDIKETKKRRPSSRPRFFLNSDTFSILRTNHYRYQYILVLSFHKLLDVPFVHR